MKKKCSHILYIVGTFLFLVVPCSFAADNPVVNFEPNGPSYAPPGTSPNTVTNPYPLQSSTNNNVTNITGAVQQGLSAPSGLTGGTGSTGGASSTAISPALGQYRNKDGTVKITKLLLDRYKPSIVRVRALDLSGNELSRSMGVSVGHGESQYIAAPLSIILGNDRQWADRIEVTHSQGNRYLAKIVYLDEQLNLALLKPEVFPAPLMFAHSSDERPQIDVYTISFSDAPNGDIIPAIHKGTLSAANTDDGTLSISSDNKDIDDTQAGTAIMNTQGELVGMLLPKGRGILASKIQAMIHRADNTTSIEPHMVGVIMGRGVLVDQDPKRKLETGVFRSISEALDAIQKGSVPKTDPTRFSPAANSLLKPKAADKVVIKVMPGTYREAKTILLPSRISLSGSGPKSTVLLGINPNAPVLWLNNTQDTNISGFRIVPASLQNAEVSTVQVQKSSGIFFLENNFEAKGGTALAFENTYDTKLTANAFPPGKTKALLCRLSQLSIEKNAFLGDWDIAISAGQDCRMDLKRNLFLQNKISLAVSSLISGVNAEQNSFLKSVAGVKVSGPTSALAINDNLFFENFYGVLASEDLPDRSYGRNGAWRTKFVSRGHITRNLDLVRTEPTFENAPAYDFRIKFGRAQVGVAARTENGDLGAYQRSDFMGPYTSQFIHALEAATGQSDLASRWGYQE